MSMVRLMIYANRFDIEGLVATEVRGAVNPAQIREAVEAYGRVRDNLERHEPGFPAETDLLSRIAAGTSAEGMAGVGAGQDTPGANRLIAALERNDPRLL